MCARRLISKGLIRQLILPLAFAALQSAEAETFLKVVSSAGDYIGRGVTQTISGADTTFSGYCSQSTATVSFDAPGFWQVNLSSPAGTLLNPDVYELASTYSFQSPTRPGLSVSGGGNSCRTSFSRFVVREINCSPNGAISKLAVDFEHRCNQTTAPPLLGYLRVNSSIPEIVPEPTASAGSDQDVEEGQHVTLDGSLSTLPRGLASVNWQQLSGPTVGYFDSSKLVTSFTAPDIASGGAILVMRLTVTGTNGLSDSNAVSIAVRDRNDPRSVLKLVSSPGDYVGGGITQTIGSLDTTFTGWCNNNLVNVSLGAPDNWQITLAGPANAPLVADVYENARSFGAHSPTASGLSVGGSGRGCDGTAGRFIIREIACAANQIIEKLAVDFEHHCYSATSPALFGYLRFKSAVPEVAVQPTADAGMDQAVLEGDLVHLNGSKSFAPDRINSVFWRQVSGPTVVFANSSVLVTSFVAPDVLPGGAVVVLELVVTGASGLVDANRMTVTVRDQSDPQTFFSVTSSPGDSVGFGRNTRLTPLDAVFSGTCFGDYAELRVNGSTNNSWIATVSSPKNTQLAVDVYEDARGLTSRPLNSPGVNVSGLDNCPSPFGRFVVRELACSSSNTLERLAVDVEQRCGSPTAPPLLAYVRFNSKIPEIVPQPTASAGIDQTVYEGRGVTLDGSRSTAPQGIASVTWQQISGPAVTLSNRYTLSPTFVAPDVPSGGAVLVFELTVVGGSGLTDSNRVSIAIRDQNDPRTYLTLVSHPDDYVGGGVTQTASELDATIFGVCGQFGARVDVNGLGLWTVRFAAPKNTTLTPGPYDQATSSSFQSTTAPGLDVYGGGRACMSTGRFDLLELTCSNSGTIERLAVNFEQHCGLTAPPLFGFLRINSSLPNPDLLDRGCRLDTDGDGSINRTRDGGLLLRSLVGFSGAALEGSDQASNATRRYDFQLKSYFGNTCALISPDAGPPGCSLDLDGDGQIRMATDGVIATRLMAGIRDDSVFANSTGANATRNSWNQLHPYLRSCNLLPL